MSDEPITAAEYICQYGNLHDNCARCDLALMLLQVGLYSYQIRDILRKMDSGQINVRYEMPYCRAVEGSPTSSVMMWCADHEKNALHIGPDGDSNVCEDFAKKMGCNCCPKNYNRQDR